MNRKQAIDAAIANVQAGEAHIAVRQLKSGEYTICPPDVDLVGTLAASRWVADVWFIPARCVIRVETKGGWEEIAV